ncbi:phosphotransferase [Streptomyces sp. ISL-11]|uniref:maltokinase N-terminal cap-like domain-containing protein n=1 Tax=Streptomyces sp. ISL-11 TaxID=2819174 RepID=UPI001BE8F27C|nr:phosphotransferase [Streptomyces sp. ISL-11]MBT2384854.1 phosphotransferase [Streptomyces sp. ISL-11]
MSDAAPSRRGATRRGAAPEPLLSTVRAASATAALRPAVGEPGLLGSLVPLLAEWLPRQRWFAGKGRPITGFTLVAATELLPQPTGTTTPGLLHLLVRAHQSGSPAGEQIPAETGSAALHTGTDDCYQLLLGVQDVLPPHLAPALIGRPSGGPLHGRTVYEGLADPRLAGLLLERLRAPGRLGPLRFSREEGAAIAPGLVPRLLGAEQSNSSVVYGETYILKLFRRVCPGINPDLELPRALAGTTCDRVPPPAAWFEAELPGSGTGPLTLGVLQPYLPGSADGWQLALSALAVRADFTASARALGHATAEVHAALADALPTVVLRRPQLEHLAATMTRRLDAAADAVPALRPYRAALRGAFDELAALGRAGRTWRAQRIHGDLHLGQALRTAEDGRWALIDFEGEPARPLTERRRPQPAARDVAGMLRSFDYAAAVGRATGGSWSERARAAFCEGYATVHGDPREEPQLLRAHETDKAVYEVLYEARHRPDWLPVPMSAIRRLAEPLSGGEADTAGYVSRRGTGAGCGRRPGGIAAPSTGAEPTRAAAVHPSGPAGRPDGERPA